MSAVRRTGWRGGAVAALVLALLLASLIPLSGRLGVSARAVLTIALRSHAFTHLKADRP